MSANQIDIECAAAWSDYRKDYGVSPDEAIRLQEFKAFKAGWCASAHDLRESVLR